MKKTIYAVILAFVFTVMTSGSALAESMSNYELMQELKKTQKRLQELEEKLESRMSKKSELKTEPEDPKSVQGLADRVRKVEDQLKETPLFGEWSKKITISGLLEAEASYEDKEFDAANKDDEESSDLTLATLELGIDADIAKHVSGHALLLWEEDDTEPVDLDEGYITLDGEDVLPMYLNVGKLYVPFGFYESHFISDPITLEIGETRESAATVGLANDMFEITASAFNGNVEEEGDDNHIDNFVGSAYFRLPEDVRPGFSMMLGGSYINNLADSDGLEGEIPNEEINDYVSGLGSFLSIAYQDRYFLKAEYVGALNDFEADELEFSNGKSLEPKAWNFEFAFVPIPDLELAAKYEGGEDLGNFQPENQYGGAITYNLFKYTSLSLEYLYGEYENEDERNLVTSQLAVEF